MTIDPSNIPVFVLCGGLGTRLKEQTESLPKPMVPVGNRPILWHVMHIYAHHGFRKFVLCLGYKSEVVKAYFLNYASMNSDFTVYVDGINNTAETIYLEFSTACQAIYYIDGFHPAYSCPQILTSNSINPFSIQTWELKHSWDEWAIQRGSHSIQGEILGYGKSEPILFTTDIEVKSDKINNFTLHQNYPNPFNSFTTFRYSLGKVCPVTLHVYNIQGKKIETLVDDIQEAGNYVVKWEPKEISSNLFIVTLIAGDFIDSIKLVLLK